MTFCIARWFSIAPPLKNKKPFYIRAVADLSEKLASSLLNNYQNPFQDDC